MQTHGELTPTRFEWESVSPAQAAKDLAEALAHIESLNPARAIDCTVVLDLEPGGQPPETHRSTDPPT
ncbi:hypothetical protein [Streptomyces sp. AC1-42T]|uniref:hypothetical protein n=1 Tax=Streptomyces sp. AC1-42T TaxID=2218665 RepID=UPI000DAEBBF4|nr:hypothetical protein [Streptomyces sp. AC1-42T]PZT71541.1 hypothetical protein DNK55_33065 [Streptomyces sp. AC1-42T]